MPHRVDIDDAYRRYGHSVLRRARRLLGSPEESAEVLQDVFLDLVHKPEQFDGRSALSSFLYRATTNRCLNRLRDRNNRIRLLEQHVTPFVEELDTRPVADLLAAQQLLACLPEDEAQVAIYFYYDEMSHQEIAEVMGCSRRHVGHLLENLSERLSRRERRHADRT